MILDLRKGFGDFDDYKLFKFPDGSVKFECKSIIQYSKVITTLRTNEDIIALLMVSDVLERTHTVKPTLFITYLMYQQDDRLFKENESFGLKVIARLINNLFFSKVEIFHPHSDKVEFIDNVKIISNSEFVASVIAGFSGIILR